MMTRPRRWLIALAVLTPLLPRPAPALAQQVGEQVLIETRSGLRYEGRVLGNDGQTLRLQPAVGNPIDLNMADIARSQVQRDLETDYALRRDALAPDDAQGYYQLMSWLVFEREAYELAKRELVGVIDRFPDDARLKQLQRIAIERSKLQAQPVAEPAPTRSNDKPAQEPAEQPETPPQRVAQQAGELDPEARLSDQDIELIRVYEIDLDERPVVTFPREMWAEVFATYGSDEKMPRGKDAQTRILAAPGHEQLRLLFDLKAREFYGQAVVRRDPPVMATFANSIHRQYVLNYCGTSQCHGGESAGRFRLFRQQPTSPRTVYSNYLILHRTGTKDGPMLNNDPAFAGESVLLQYGLDREVARYPHPAVEGWRPYARFGTDPLNSPAFLEIEAWMRALYVGPREGYPVAWQAPSQLSAQPETPPQPEPLTPPGSPAPPGPEQP